MMWIKNLLITVTLFSLVACGGGSGGDSNSTPANSNLSKTTLIYNKSPRINESITLNIEDNTSEITKDYTWLVIESPPSSNLQLTISTNTKSVQFTPTKSGRYKLTATPESGDSIETQFLIVKEFPINSSKLIGYDSSEELSVQSGIISNQAWVYSKTLSESAIRAIVNNYSTFTIIGFDEIRGLLIEYNEASAQSQNNINALKTRSGIYSVDRRFFEGKNLIKDSLKIANDGSRFDDGGDNWHLEHIGIAQAWDISTGNNNFNIGITESYGIFHTEHEDLKGRFKEATKATISNLLDDELDDSIGRSFHATGVAGAIGAISNNEKGMSGINWSNQLMGGIGTFEGLTQTISKDSVALVNNSWLMVGHPPEEHDPENPARVEALNEDSYEKSRDYRKLADRYSDKLFVYGAGNGIGNGLGFKGAYGIDGQQSNPSLHYDKNELDESILQKLSNVIFVSALLNDNRLAFYSNFGDAVDIAAPTGYKSTKLDLPDIPFLRSFDQYYDGENYGINNSNAGFKGTSAATPVVTGVASLLLAADSELSATDIKSIIINSATEFVTERYIHPGNEDEDFFGPGPVGSKVNIETLSHPIPILNAAAALAMAKELKEAREEAGLLTAVTPLTTSETFNFPGNADVPSFTTIIESGHDGDIESDLFLTHGIASLRAVDIQTAFGVSKICEDGINDPVLKSSTDYLSSTISKTAYINGQVAASCSANFETILPITLTNANISDVLETEGSPLNSDCLNANETPATQEPPPINTSCTSITISNYLITDDTGKQHKVSQRVTTDFDN